MPKITLVALLAFITHSTLLHAQCGEPPRLIRHFNTITVSGQTVHISGSLPKNSDQWLYHVTCRSGRLFDFYLWTVSQFKDRDGFFLANSWDMQILDSKDNPETEVIFDKEAKFFFWGGAIYRDGHERIRVDSIDGLPDGVRGTVILDEVPQEKQLVRRRSH
jgi:hypothetical protein